jgi:hypothetical protein
MLPAALLALGGSALAQAPAPSSTPAASPSPQASPADETIWHEVQPGETLQGITRATLGSAELWEDNWRLNPTLKDPHRLAPGQRILIYSRRKGRTAEIRGLSRKVEQKPHPELSWLPAHLGDVLRTRDGVRTYERSSAELAFDDGSSLVITEMSLVFLRERAQALEGEPARRSVEILEGQADLAAKPRRTAQAPGIEIVVGGATATPRQTADRDTQARARTTGGGGAQLMVFGGAADLAAGGTQVQVAEGMGSTVQKGGAPTPPEKLLPASRMFAPVPGTSYDHANPRLSWQPVEGAASYTLEVCRDLACGELVERATRVRGTRFTPDGLPLGALYVRVTAVSTTGLDGFPSPAVRFSISALWRRPDARDARD